MVIKAYSVSLEEEVVEEAKKVLKPYGGQLSPVINSLIKEYLKKEKDKKENR